MGRFLRSSPKSSLFGGTLPTDRGSEDFMPVSTLLNCTLASSLGTPALWWGIWTFQLHAVGKE